MLFHYLGRNQAGEKVHGTVDADNTESAAEILLERHITPLDINPGKDRQGIKINLEQFMSGKIKLEEILNFSRQMHVMISAGIPIVQALTQLSKAAKSKKLQETLALVAEGVTAGKSLADTLGEYSKIFSPVYVNLISVGESTGKLESSFAETAKFLETVITNRKRLIATIRYPIIVIASAVIAMLVMNVMVVPKFVGMFARQGVTLPLPTRILMASSTFLLNYWPWMIASLIAIFVVGRYLLPVARIKYLWDKYKLRAPIMGSLAQRIIMSQFTRSFAMVLRSGVPVLKGLELVASVSGNAYIEQEILKLKDAIDQGSGLSQAASGVNLFNTVSLQMLEVGDATGKMDEMLDKVADAYEGDIDFDLKRLTDLLEPILLIIIGTMVVILALAIYLPMWDMIKVMK